MSNTELLIQITDTEQTVVNKANALLRYDKLTNAERIALLREMNIGNSTIQKNTVYIRIAEVVGETPESYATEVKFN